MDRFLQLKIMNMYWQHAVSVPETMHPDPSYSAKLFICYHYHDRIAGAECHLYKGYLSFLGLGGKCTADFPGKSGKRCAFSNAVVSVPSGNSGSADLSDRTCAGRWIEVHLIQN